MSTSTGNSRHGSEFHLHISINIWKKYYAMPFLCNSNYLNIRTPQQTNKQINILLGQPDMIQQTIGRRSLLYLNPGYLKYLENLLVDTENLLLLKTSCHPILPNPPHLPAQRIPLFSETWNQGPWQGKKKKKLLHCIFWKSQRHQPHL